MRQGFQAQHWEDRDGHPAGGCSYGTGFTISWQNGPLDLKENRQDPNGAFVEDVLRAVENRLAWYQASEFWCSENEAAMGYLRGALYCLDSRTKEREARNVEGTHTP